MITFAQSYHDSGAVNLNPIGYQSMVFHGWSPLDTEMWLEQLEAEHSATHAFHLRTQFLSIDGQTGITAFVSVDLYKIVDLTLRPRKPSQGEKP